MLNRTQQIVNESKKQLIAGGVGDCGQIFTYSAFNYIVNTVINKSGILFT